MMKKLKIFFGITLVVITGAVPVAAQDAAAPVKIAVMDLKAKQGIAGPVVSSLTDYTCTQIDRLGGYEVLGREDMQAMLEHIADRQILDCDDTKCLAQVGGALGVSRLVSGNIGMIGTRYLINFKLIDIDEVRVVQRISRTYQGGEGGLIDEMNTVVAELFGRPAPPRTSAPSVTAAVPDVRRNTGTLNCTSSKVKGEADAEQVQTSGWLLAGLGCGAGLGCLGGGVLYMLAGQDSDVTPDDIPDGVDPNCYLMGFKERRKKKKKSSACIGGITGALLAAVIISSQVN